MFSRRRLPRPALPSAAIAALVAAFPAALIAAAPPPTSAAPSTGEFVVFMGLDVSVADRGSDAPIVAVSESTLAITRNGQEVKMPIRDAQFRTRFAPRLSPLQLTIEKLAGEALHDPRTDPGREALQQQLTMDSIQAHSQEIATMQANQAAQNAANTERISQQPNSPVTQADVQRANAAAAEAATRMDAAYATPIFASALPGSGGATDDTVDAFEVTFRLSSPVEIPGAYGLLRLQVRSPTAPQQPFAVLKFFSLRNTGPDPRRYSIMQTGLPPGFKVDSYSVHIFSDGREVPSNLSANRLAVNLDEAHQFVILRHIQVNPAGTLPAQALPELVPAGVRERLSGARRDITVDLSIDRDGRVSAVKSINGPSGLPDDVLTAQLREIRFLPALVQGSASASEGTFAIGELLVDLD